uniref:ABC transmembrane type-1 domain-containing protein n=1 Tax=Steinernema glaseri TaxID=37863 RepID=A0A1I8A9W9_9BILA
MKALRLTDKYLAHLGEPHFPISKRNLNISLFFAFLFFLFLNTTLCLLTTIWFVTLVGLFVNVKFLTRRYLESYTTPYFASFLAFAVVSVFLGQLVKVYGEIAVKRTVLIELGPPHACSSGFLRFLLGESRCVDYHNELSKSLLWELNPFNIAVFSARDLSLSIGDAVGTVVGRTISVFIQELPYVLLVPIIACLCTCCCTTLLLLFGYTGRFTILKGIFEFSFSPAVKKRKPRDGNRRSPGSNAMKMQETKQRGVKVIKELYQKRSS